MLKNILIIALLLLTTTGYCLTKESETNKITELNSSQAYQIITKEKNILLLDVRTEEEYNHSHINGSYLIPHTDLSKILDKVTSNKYSKIVIYCRTKNRSKLVAQFLLDNNIENIYIIADGFSNWMY